MKNKVGIMQGRLSPSEDDRLQFFPKHWQSEFEIAKGLGFDLIEWILDREGDFCVNPFWTASTSELDPDLLEIERVSSDSGVGIETIGLDYFMKYSLVNPDNSENRHRLNVFLHKASFLGIEIVVLPLHEDVALKSEKDRAALRLILNSFKSMLDRLNIVIALEAEIPADEFRDYVLSFNDSRIGICYDTGNMASMGYDLSDDIHVLGDLIKEVHLKDRKVGSTQSVHLGTGDVPFGDCFNAFRSIGFSGPYIIQAWREEDYLADAKNQLEFVKSHSNKGSR